MPAGLAAMVAMAAAPAGQVPALLVVQERAAMAALVARVPVGPAGPAVLAAISGASIRATTMQLALAAAAGPAAVPMARAVRRLAAPEQAAAVIRSPSTRMATSVAASSS